MTPRLILLTSLSGDALDRLLDAFGPEVVVSIACDLDALRAAPINSHTSLIGFGTGVIVPKDVLARLTEPAYNLHAASPEFPGRDPHHHAVYHGATTYGATLHVMTARVDEGPIVGLRRFPVMPNATPEMLLRQANEAGVQLIESLGSRLLQREPLPALQGVKWGSVKTRRADLRRLCALSTLVSSEEFARRFRAFDGASYDNLTTDLHGHTFRIDKRAKSPKIGTRAFAEFTETGFRTLLQLLKAEGYRCELFGSAQKGRHVLLRHDIDLSVHRALRMAEIEAEEDSVATFFVNPRSAFYSLFEPEIEPLLLRIRLLGHQIALHFDSAAYPIDTWTLEALKTALDRERSLVETVLRVPVTAVSWHNPDLSNLLDFDAEEIDGLFNVYCRRLRRDYTYCSDSNGYWRYKPVSEVVLEGPDRLHLLIHPEWWTPEGMSPSERVDRALLGRARKIRRNYDALLSRGGRQNVTTNES